MLTLKYLLLSAALCLFMVSVGLLAYDVLRNWLIFRRNLGSPEAQAAPAPLRWRSGARIAANDVLGSTGFLPANSPQK